MKLTWDITNKCNLRCKHCGAIDLLNNAKEEYKNWKKVIDYASDFVDYISLLGGEPLLHPDITEIIEYCNQKSIEVLIITNGQVSPHIIDDIMKHDIKSMFVSIEGMETSNDKIRGKGSWEKSVATLRHIASLNRYKTRKVQLGVNIVVNKINIKDVIPFIEYTKDLDIAYQISSLALKGNAENNADELVISDATLLDFYETISTYHLHHPQYNISLLDVYPVVKDYLNKKTGSNYQVNPFSCDALLDDIYVNPYGELCACQGYTDIKLNVDEINNWAKDFSKLQPFLDISHRKSENKTCITCPYQDVCIPCPLKKNFETPGICEEAISRIKSITIPTESKFTLCKPYAICDSDDYYEIYYPSLGTKTEYSIEGYKILNAIREPKTLQEISKEVSYSPEIIYKFLEQEKASHKVVESRVS